MYSNRGRRDALRHDGQKTGRSLFNATLGCAHCHGPSAKAVEDKVDLRLLHRRHGNLAQRVFQETVMYGRPGTEMPEWRASRVGGASGRERRVVTFTTAEPQGVLLCVPVTFICRTG